MVVRTKPPVWFTVAAVLLLLWNLLGAYICVQQFRLGADAMGPATPYQRALFERLPRWLGWDFAFTEVMAVGGALALLARARIAAPLAVLAVIGVVLQFGYLLGATDIVAQEGFATAAGLPIVIFVIAVMQAWLSRIAAGRGWIG